MGWTNAVVNSVNKAITIAVAKGDTRAVKGLRDIIESDVSIGAYTKQLSEDHGMPVDVSVHRTTHQGGDLNEGNFNYKAGLDGTAGDNKAEGVYTSPLRGKKEGEDAVLDSMYGTEKYAVVTPKDEKLGMSKHTLPFEGAPNAVEGVGEQFATKHQVQAIEPLPEFKLNVEETVLPEITNALDNFKIGSLEGKTKKNLKGQKLKDETIVGLFMDTIKVLDENVAGQSYKVADKKVYKAAGNQQVIDKIGKTAERRIVEAGGKKVANTREFGAQLVHFARGNFSKLLKEENINIQGKGIKEELHITTSPDFKDWYKAGGKSLMKAFESPRLAAEPSTSYQGAWKVGANGKVTGAPKGLETSQFFAGEAKSRFSLSTMPSVVKSLNILGKTRTGMDQDFFSIWKNLRKKGGFKESPKPRDEFNEAIAKNKLTEDEKILLQGAYDEIDRIAEASKKGTKVTGAEYMAAKEQVFGSTQDGQILKALNKIKGEVKQSYEQRGAKQGVDRRIENELNDRGENAVHFVHNVDSRGRAYAKDSSGASIYSGGVIRHGFVSENSKPITINSEGYKNIIDELVMFDETAGLGKAGGSGLDRHAHWIQHKSKYLAQGEEALKNANNPDWKPKWLPAQKDQGPYLRSVMEIARIHQADAKGIPYESKMLVELDATASGSQHIGAQYGDTEILWQTGVISDKVKLLTNDELRLIQDGVPADSIARDLYGDVGNKYWSGINNAFEQIAQTDPQKALLLKEYTSKYMSGGRSTVKPIVMKVPYGAGDGTLKKDLVSQLSGRQQLEMAQKGLDPEELMDFHWNTMQDALQDGLKTQYEFKEFNKAIGDIYGGKVDKKKGYIGYSNRKPLVIDGPFGGKTDLTRYIMKSKEQQMTFRGELTPDLTPNKQGLTKTSVYTQNGVDDFGVQGVKGVKGFNKGIELDAQQTRQGLAPNITHSMDAAYLHKLVEAADANGIEVRAIHDAFLVHPNDVNAMKKIAGQVFQEMHSNYNVRDAMIKGLADAVGEDVSYIRAALQNKGINLDTAMDIGNVPTEQLSNVIRGG